MVDINMIQYYYYRRQPEEPEEEQGDELHYVCSILNSLLPSRLHAILLDSNGRNSYSYSFSSRFQLTFEIDLARNEVNKNTMVRKWEM